MSTALRRLIGGLTPYERQQIELRFSQDAEVLALIQQPTIDYDLPTRCSLCGKWQRTSARGVTCSSGHTGASPILLTPGDWRIFDTAYNSLAVRVVVHHQRPRSPEYLVLEVAAGAPGSPRGWQVLLGNRQIAFQPQCGDNSPHTPPMAWADEQFAGLRYEGKEGQAVLVLADGRWLDEI